MIGALLARAGWLTEASLGKLPSVTVTSDDNFCNPSCAWDLAPVGRRSSKVGRRQREKGSKLPHFTRHATLSLVVRLF